MIQDHDELCEPCGRCARCERNFKARADVMKLRAALRRAKKQIEKLRAEHDTRGAGRPGTSPPDHRRQRAGNEEHDVPEGRG